MKKTIIISAIGLALAFGTFSCSSNEFIENGKTIACQLKEAEADLATHPDNAMFKMDVDDLKEQLEDNRTKSGNTEAFDKAIEEASENCK